MQGSQPSNGFKFFLIVLSIAFVSACGSGDGETPVSDTPLTGVLLDGPTGGVEFNSDGQSGITNAQGEFTYFPGQSVVFSIGGIRLGEIQTQRATPGAGNVVITPVELTGSADATDPAVIRMLQLLQTLDEDGDHSNGITISGATRSAAGSVVVDFADPAFTVNNPTFDLQIFINDLAASGAPDRALISPAQALQNFSNTIADNNLNISITPSFQLVWSDEFTAPLLDTENNWNIELGYGDGAGEPGAGWGNDEWQLYTGNSENLSIVFGAENDPQNGYLKISAQCPTAPDCGKRTDQITSAKINTKDKREFQFGMIEARIKVPTGKGAWPAFWSLGAGYPETPWPAAGEIDFMEVFNLNNSTSKDALFTIHWEEPDGSGTRQFLSTGQQIDASEFHVFQAQWTEDRLIGRIDGVQFASYTFDPATQSELLNPFYLILNVAMGGNPSPDLVPDATTVWPQEMLVDYVRVYQAVGDLNAPIINIDFEGVSEFVCFEDGAGCGGATGFAGGDASVQPNPDTTGNASANVGRFLKFNPGNGQAFGGTLIRLTDDALDFAASNNIFTVKVYSNRSVPVRLELGDDNPNDGSPGVEVTHTGSGWEELAFDVSGIVSQVTRFNQIVFIFDNGVIGDATGDPDNWTFYFDDIVLQRAVEDTGPDTGTGGTDGGSGGTASGGSVPNNTILAADGTAADLTSTFTGFDSQTGTAIVATDSSYGNALQVTVANGYAPTLNLAQLFITGLSGLDAYGEFLFKVKGLTDNNLVMKVEPPAGPDVAINLATPGAGITVTDLGDGWSQVVVDLAQFGDIAGSNVVILQTLDNAYNLGDTFLLTDIGFNNAGPVTATGGSLPDASFLKADGAAADLTTTFTGFDSQTGTAVVSTDTSYGNALQVTVANGYAPTLNLAQLFLPGLSGLDAYGEFLFKVKGLTDNNLVMKMEPPAGPDVAINLATPGAGITVTDLGDGWSQVVVNLTQFGDLSTANVVILQTLDNAYALGDTFLLTDIGFNNAGPVTATGGSLPDASFLKADGAAADLTTTFTGFDSQTGTAVVSTDTSYGNALQVTVANGYAPTLNLAQLFLPGLSGLDAYGEFLFKVKGLTDNNLVMKMEPPAGPDVAINLATPGAGITVTDLGDGWSQVVVNLTQFGDLSTANVVILQTLDNAYNLGDTFLLTDIGFNNAGPVTATGGSLPDASFLKADGAAADLTTTFTGFDSQTGTAVVSTDTSYGNALQVTVANGYAPTLNLAQLFLPGLSGLDAYGEFLFKVKGLTDNNLVMKMEPPAGPDVAINLATPGAGITVTDLGDGWSQVVVDLAQFGDLSTANVVILQTLDNAYALGDTFLLTDIGFNNVTVGPASIAVNGGFEANNFTGWTQFESTPGNQTINTSAPGDTSSEGGFHLRINNTTTGTNSLIKQERAGVGTVQPGASWTVTFDARGSFGPGGVAFAQVFSETAGGPENCSGCGILGSAPLALNADSTVWTSFSFSGSVGPNSESLTLQLEAVTGGSNLADVYYDNISIVVQ